MSGREDAGACAIRVMLADDHHVTLCGMAMILDVPFALEWLYRSEAQGRTPTGQVANGTRSCGTKGVKERAKPRDAGAARGIVPNAIDAPNGMSDRIVVDVNRGGMAADGPPSPPVSSLQQSVSASPALASSAGPLAPAAWHPATNGFTSMPSARAPRRSALPRVDHGDIDDDEDAGEVRALFAVRGGFEAIAAYRGYTQACMRDGLKTAARTGARGAVKYASPRRDRPPFDVVVTGAYSRSVDLFDALAGTPCDVLICDLAMGEGPHGDGLTMIGYLRRHYPRIKLIVHTMCLHACVLRNLQLLNVQGILSKMDDLALVPTAIQMVQKGGTFRGPSITAALVQAGYPESETTRPAIWSPREAEVIRRFVNGDPVKHIAQALNRSVKTVSTQKMSAMHKAGISSNAELYQYAAANGLLSIPGVASTAWQWHDGGVDD
ncbi:response regulator transcription factor [Robbsia andropogonis]|uniref:response regulator transcription factor n=1 Tax=Robbsia andropogonis TaxID=28092 RepID=UPI000467AF3A|nr:response regulator transcription factor [Robbsia andropogonis]MCP1117217.1 response regulator transcription factor [Robbsia andropogonis]MCP1128563.1 response regulator transcription factor [Robbsia andropogonis]